MLPPPEELGRLLEDDLVVADVGARWGAADRWRSFGSRVKVVGFDPDIGGRGGQVYWAHAYFVADDMAHFITTPSRAETVLDACTASAFGFADLALSRLIAAGVL